MSHTTPRLSVVRVWLGVLGVLLAGLLVYASIVPVTPRYTSFYNGVDGFLQLRWLDLNVYRRADWVANALVVIPAGFCLAGAVDFGKPHRWALLLAAPLIFLNLATLVVVIEFLQFWFPPRTRSQNDVFAGVIGAAAGPALWLICGRPILRGLILVCTGPVTKQRVGWLLALFVLANFAYSLMPLDLMVSKAEWQKKWDAGRIVLVPELGMLLSLSQWKGWILAAARTAVVGFLATLYRGPKFAFAVVVFVAIVCELLQLPTFTRQASTTDVLAGVAGGGLGIWVANRWAFWLGVLEKPIVWLGLFATCLLGIVAVLLVRDAAWVDDPEIIAGHWLAFFTWPMSKYYYTSEFSAGTNVLAKLIVFAAAGYLLHGAVHCSKPKVRLGLRLTGWAVIFMVGTIIEVGQVYLTTGVSDASDVLIYLLGAALGGAAFPALRPDRLADPRGLAAQGNPRGSIVNGH